MRGLLSEIMHLIEFIDLIVGERAKVGFHESSRKSRTNYHLSSSDMNLRILLPEL